MARLRDIPWSAWIALAAAGVAVGVLVRKITHKPMPVAALDVALAEDEYWGDRAPSIERIDEYFLGVDGRGKDLASMNTAGDILNFCAAAVGWTEAATGRGDLPPWRAVAKKIMRDAQAGRRGPWYPKSHLATGWRPPVGALAIYTRGPPEGPYGHVDRVSAVYEDGYDAVGANAGGRKWDIDFTPWTAPKLLGFVVDAEEPRVSPASQEMLLPIPPGLIEPPLTQQQRAEMRSAA